MRFGWKEPGCDHVAAPGILSSRQTEKMNLAVYRTKDNTPEGKFHEE